MQLIKTVTFALAFGALTIQTGCQRTDASTDSRRFHFMYEVTVPIVENIEDSIQLWIPVPQDNEFQNVTNLNIRSLYDYEIGIDPVYGNKMIHITAPPSAREFTVSLSFNLKRREAGTHKANLTSSKRDLYLQPVTNVPRDARFEQIAAKVLTYDSIKENARALFDHTLVKMAYDKSGEGWGRGDAIYACDIGKGNCTDFHSFFNAVARTAGIPARFKIGFPIPDEETGDIPGYHCWTEFYSPEDGWIPVDISEADKNPALTDYLFGNLDPNRVLFTVGRDVELVPPSANGPVNFFIYPVMEVGGVRKNNYSLQFSFEDIE